MNALSVYNIRNGPVPRPKYITDVMNSNILLYKRIRILNNPLLPVGLKFPVNSWKFCIFVQLNKLNQVYGNKSFI